MLFFEIEKQETRTEAKRVPLCFVFLTGCLVWYVGVCPPRNYEVISDL